jgi:DNA-binding NarL/FixJ family response regulator
MPHQRIRVLLVDGHQVVREGLRLLIETEGLTVVGDTGRGAGAADLCARTTPDVLLVDPVLPDLTGVEVLRAIRERAPGVPVIALTATADAQLVRAWLAAGAWGCLLKSVDRGRLLGAIREATRGRSGRAPAAAAARDDLAAAPARDDPAARSGLTNREREVLDLVARGRTNKVIAQELAISAGTVRVYISEILVKLGAANRTEAAMIGLQRGLVALAAADRSGRPAGAGFRGGRPAAAARSGPVPPGAPAGAPGAPGGQQ